MDIGARLTITIMTRSIGIVGLGPEFGLRHGHGTGARRGTGGAPLGLGIPIMARHGVGHGHGEAVGIPGPGQALIRATILEAGNHPMVTIRNVLNQDGVPGLTVTALVAAAILRATALLHARGARHGPVTEQ